MDINSTTSEYQTLGSFAPFSYGKGLPKRKRNLRGSVPVYGSNGVVGFHDTALTSGPTIIIGRKGTVGTVHYSAEPCWPIDTTFYVEGNDPELLRYKYYLLKSLGLDQMNSDSAVPGLNRNNAHARRITVPAVSQQRLVSQILGTLDDKIELNRQMSETLEETAKTLFKSWFIDFDPVRAKIEGRQPSLPAHIADFFSDRLIDSELGPIPEGWKPVSLPDIMDIDPRRSLKKGELAPYLGMVNMPTQIHRPTKVGIKAFTSGKKFINGDTLVARITPCLENGKTAFVDFLRDGEVGWGSTEYIVMHPKPPLPQSFPYFLARTPEFRDFAINTMTGSSGRQRVPPQALSAFSLPMPSVEIVQAFGNIVQSLTKRSAHAVDEATMLSSLRDLLLLKLCKDSKH